MAAASAAARSATLSACATAASLAACRSATPGNGSTVGFAMTPEQADAWHAAGVANGGTAIEDPPGERPGSGMYLAYLRDPDGNKLCALHRIGS